MRVDIKSKRRFLVATAGALSIPIMLAATAAQAEMSNKLLLTGGVSQVEGAAGGGLTPWAVIGGYGTNNELGANIHYTHAKSSDFKLETYGVTIGILDRVELSLAEQRFDVSDLRKKVRNGLGVDAIGRDEIKQLIAGVKVRVAGEAILDQDIWMPQIAVGVQYKKNQDDDLITGPVVGADRDSGIDVYASATKLLLDKSLLLNGTLRFTKANQFGLLGFGGDKHGDYRPQLELSAAYLLNRKLAIGAEYRMKPNNLKNTVGGAVNLKEDDAFDIFVAYAPTKNVSLTAAYVYLGNIVEVKAVGADYGDQDAIYLSAQFGF
jgi:opacity protein-like surface antigen